MGCHSSGRRCGGCRCEQCGPCTRVRQTWAGIAQGGDVRERSTLSLAVAGLRYWTKLLTGDWWKGPEFELSEIATNQTINRRRRGALGW